MEYVINVARPCMDKDRCYFGNVPYVHYFKVIVPYGHVKKVYLELKDKYPDHHITVCKWETIGTKINMDECNF